MSGGSSQFFHLFVRYVDASSSMVSDSYRCACICNEAFNFVVRTETPSAIQNHLQSCLRRRFSYLTIIHIRLA